MTPTATGSTLSEVSGWRPTVLLGIALALACTVTPWNVLQSNGLSMPGHTLVAAQLILGFVVLVLAGRAETRAPGLSSTALVLLVIAGTAFTALADMSQAQAFSLEWADVRALGTARVMVGGVAVLAMLFCVSGAIRHDGERRKLELGLAAFCGMVLGAATLWQPLADLTHPMRPAVGL